MPREPHDLRRDALPGPPPEARERVLAACREAFAARVAHCRRRRIAHRWGFAAAVALLLLVNATEERRTRVQIASIRAEAATVAQGAEGDRPIIGSLRARASLLASLLRDASAL